MAKQTEFNKVLAFDELMKIVQVPQNATISEGIRALQNGQDYIQKIHDSAFEQGFEHGCDATKKIDEI
ncbi:hypothetical protein [Flavobacterium covae]|uniref:hypothetical protein n=1 Tax=Flavobacterium covae TaxID=2906076 RepID=UPI000745DA39|nr:hypothetical protein [Flavobacterium covae]AMA48965.1 hypothetical protein AWN65_05555 [Flavobacterium covae]MCJ1809883.1 hypothetical protein [Flavobacterium covae]